MSSRINAVCGNENQTDLSDTFGLIGKFFKISIFNILTGQK